MATEDDIKRLRADLGESIPEGGEEGATFFTDESLEEMLTNAGGDFNAAAMQGWIRKAAIYSRLIDVAESGSERKLSQKYRQAKAQAEFFKGLASDSVAQTQGSYRTGPVSAKIAREEYGPAYPSPPYTPESNQPIC